jgi:phage tail protein X
MLALVRKSGDSLDWAAYRSLSRRWEIWGAVALAAPALAAALMIMKPALPGLRDLF